MEKEKIKQSKPKVATRNRKPSAIDSLSLHFVVVTVFDFKTFLNRYKSNFLRNNRNLISAGVENK